MGPILQRYKGPSYCQINSNVPVNCKTAHPPHRQTPGHLTFLELQRGSNPPHSKGNRIAYLWK